MRSLMEGRLSMKLDQNPEMRWKSRIEVQKGNRTEIIGFFYIYAMNSEHRIDYVLNNIKNWLESIIYIRHSASTHWSAYIGSGGPNKEYK